MKEKLSDILKLHTELYPSMTFQDMVKLIYQNEFGPGHMITEKEKSLDRLKQEWTSLSRQPSAPSFVSIGNGLLRLNLHSLPALSLPFLNELFVTTANIHKGSLSSFEHKLELLLAFCKNMPNMGSEKQLRQFLTDYRAKEYPALSHSTAFRLAYAPAYRVIGKSFAAYLPLLSHLDTLLKEKGSLVIAVDGNCAAGKTVLSDIIASCFDCNMIHMDDFFLPPALRTAKRFSEPGGNIHYERFLTEVILPLTKRLPVCYRQFSCREMAYSGSVTLQEKPLTVIEGSYSMREEFRPAYDLTIFLSCSPEEQLLRIRDRSGEEMLRLFLEKWIPMENTYFDSLQIAASCDEVICTDSE